MLFVGVVVLHFFVNVLLSKYAYANLKFIYSNDIYYIENIVFLKPSGFSSFSNSSGLSLLFNISK